MFRLCLPHAPINVFPGEGVGGGGTAGLPTHESQTKNSLVPTFKSYPKLIDRGIPVI